MADQSKVAELRKVFGVPDPNELVNDEDAPPVDHTPTAEMEAKRRRDQLRDMIARDMFNLLIDKDFVQHWFKNNADEDGESWSHHHTVQRAARAASDIAWLAVGQMDVEFDDGDEREMLFSKHRRARGLNNEE